MKKILYLFLAVSALFAVACQETVTVFEVTPTALEFNGDAGTQIVTVTAEDTWAVKITEGSSWLSSSNTYGKTSATVEISVTANSATPRTGELVFSCSGQSIKVAVSQAAGTLSPKGGFGIATMLETLASTEEGKKLLDAVQSFLTQQKND